MYIIAYDNIGMIIGIILVIIYSFLYKNDTKRSNLFVSYSTCAAVECFMDVLTARIIDGGIPMSDAASLGLNTFYFYMTFLTAYMGFLMTSERMNFKNKLVHRGALVNFLIAIALLFFNVFSGFFFTIQNGQYIKTDNFWILYIFSIILLGSIPVITWTRTRTMRKDERVAPICFSIVLLTAYLVQLIFPTMLLNGFGKSVSALVYLLILETPEHVRIREVVEELEIAREKELDDIARIKRVSDAKNQFLVRMTHELRTPINAILGFNEIMDRECATDEVKGDIVKLEKLGGRLIDIVDNVLDFSQMQSGQLELKPREYEIISSFFAFQDFLDRRGVSYLLTIEREVDERIPKRLYADNKKIMQISEKLCNFLHANTAESRIKLDVLLDRIVDNIAYVDIVVYDFFCSIKAEELDYIMDVTGQTKRPESRTIEEDIEVGIARAFVLNMGGEFIVSNPDKGGIEFRCRLPLEIVDLKPIGKLDAAMEEYNNNNHGMIKESFLMPDARILAVDDTAVNLLIIDGLLRPYKVSLTKAASGEEAIELMKKQEFDLVFMDILMPGMDGKETLLKIKENPDIISKDAVIVALTANVFYGAKDFYVSKGFADYVTKPVSGDMLGRVLREHLPDKIRENWSQVEVTEGDNWSEVSDIADAGTLPQEKKEINSFEDIEGLDYSTGLSLCMDDLDIYAEVVDSYISNDMSEKLDMFFNDKNWKEYSILIHGAKSASASIGLTGLSEGAKALEMASKGDDEEYIIANHDKWIADYKNYLEELKTVMAKLNV